jgi:hypothetical protein
VPALKPVAGSNPALPATSKTRPYGRVFVFQSLAISIAVQNNKVANRFTALEWRLAEK